MIKIDFSLEPISDQICVHCKTRNDARMLLEFLDKNGYKWCTGIRYANHFSWLYGKNTVYYPGRGTYGHIKMVQKGVEVIEAEVFLSERTEDLTESDLDLETLMR